jgi:DegV family protein with EDD domain
MIRLRILKYLYMGGRIGKAKHLVGSLLSVKPLIGMEDGVIVPLGTARSRNQAYRAIADMVEKAVGSGSKIKIAYVHAAASEEAQKLRELVEARLQVVEGMFSELSPALGVHSGLGQSVFVISVLNESLSPGRNAREALRRGIFENAHGPGMSVSDN